MVEEKENTDAADPDWILLSNEESPFGNRYSAAYFLVSHDALLTLLHRCTECGALIDADL